LREGLVELYKRKKDHDGAVAVRSKAKQEDRNRRLHAPQREDERLTDPTIKEANRILQSGPIPDPNRETRVAEKAARVQAKEAAREEQRKNALHTLYMQARTFITNEEELDAKIEEIFMELREGESDSIWDLSNAPPLVHLSTSQLFRNLLHSLSCNYSRTRMIAYCSLLRLVD